MSSNHQLIKAAKLSGADKKLLAEINAQYQAIGEVQAQTAAVTHGTPNPPVHQAVNAAIVALEAEPTLANAEALNAALARREQAVISAGHIANSLHHAFLRTSAKLRPLAARVLDDCEAVARETHKTQREAMITGGVDKAVMAAHEAKLAEILRNLEGERKSAEAHALDFFMRHGIGMD